MMSPFCALLAALLAAQAARGDDDQPDFATRTITKEAIAAHIATLASDQYEGREPGTNGEKLTLEYLQRTFKAASVRPGNGKSFLQPVLLIEVTQDGVPSLSVTAGDEQRTFEP